MDKPLSGACAIIKTKQGKATGVMINISCTQNVRTEEIKGLGDFYPQRIDPMSWSGSGRCEHMFIDLKQSGLQDSVYSNAGDAETFANTMLLNRESFDLFVYAKKIDHILTNGVVSDIKEKPLFIIEGITIESDSIDISVDRITRRNQSFKFSRPILYINE